MMDLLALEISRRALLRGVMGGLMKTLVPGGGAECEPTLFRVNVPVKNLPRALDGLRIGQVSDVHVGATLGVDHLQRALALFRTNPPDILVATGDLVDDAQLARPCLDALATVRAGLGRFYILGNHENYAGREDIIATARAHESVHFALDEDHEIRAAGLRMRVLGLDYPMDERMGLSFRFAPVPHPVTRRTFPHLANEVERAAGRVAEADFRLCLVHHPETFDALPGSVELTLSGHTHGGQVAPWGTMLANSAFKYPLGLYKDGGRHLYVNGGTGHWLPLRVGVPAEVTELTLRRV